MNGAAFVLIGNSDDRKLTQQRWELFQAEVRAWLLLASWHPGGGLHFDGSSQPDAPHQNACWSLQLPDNQAVVDRLRAELVTVAGKFGQDPIVWAQTPTVEFLAYRRDGTAVR